MNPEDIVHFLPAEELFEKSAKIFEAKKKELEGILPPVDIQHTGSSSVPGLIGKLDTDIQIRTTRDQFQDVVDLMHRHYAPKHPEIWDEGFVTFCDNREHLIDLMVTVIGSRYDDFYRTRDMLIADKQLREAYNQLKLRYEGKPYGEYRKAKQQFIGPNGNVRFLEY